MKKFDEKIIHARRSYEPSVDFVDKTMVRITPRKFGRTRKFSVKIWAPALVGVLGVFAIVFVATVQPEEQQVVGVNKTIAPPAKQDPQPVPSETPAPISDGTDDSSLQGDLDAIQEWMNQIDKDQHGVDAAFNDSAQQIKIPN